MARSRATSHERPAIGSAPCARAIRPAARDPVRTPTIQVRRSALAAAADASPGSTTLGAGAASRGAAPPGAGSAQSAAVAAAAAASELRTLGRTRLTLACPVVALALFSWLMIGLFAVLLAGIVALGLFSPRSGADVLDWRPTRSPEDRAEDEADDIAQMLAAANALRRRRGAPERTEADVAAGPRPPRDEG